LTDFFLVSELSRFSVDHRTSLSLAFFCSRSFPCNFWRSPVFFLSFWLQFGFSAVLLTFRICGLAPFHNRGSFSPLSTTLPLPHALPPPSEARPGFYLRLMLGPLLSSPALTHFFSAPGCKHFRRLFSDFPSPFMRLWTGVFCSHWVFMPSPTPSFFFAPPNRSPFLLPRLFAYRLPSLCPKPLGSFPDLRDLN